MSENKNPQTQNICFEYNDQEQKQEPDRVKLENGDNLPTTSDKKLQTLNYNNIPASTRTFILKTNLFY